MTEEAANNLCTRRRRRHHRRICRCRCQCGWQYQCRIQAKFCGPRIGAYNGAAHWHWYWQPLPIVVLRFMLNVLLPNCEQDSFMFQHIEQHEAGPEPQPEDAYAVRGGVVVMAINRHRHRRRHRHPHRHRHHHPPRRPPRHPALRQLACEQTIMLLPTPLGPLCSYGLFKFDVCTAKYLNNLSCAAVAYVAYD